MPKLPPDRRDAMWNWLTAALLEQGFYTDARDHPAIRESGRIIIPLMLIQELWDIGHGDGQSGRKDNMAHWMPIIPHG
jgi:hypothetical protein